MTFVTISLMIAFGIYMVYNAIAIGNFGIPRSLSETYYLYKDKYKCGFVFPVMMLLVVGFMMPAWLALSDGSSFQFLSFLAPASLLFVGATPAFKSSDIDDRVHTWSAYFAAVCSLLWVILVTPYWWVILLWFAVIALTALATRSVKSSLVYWLETVTFFSTFLSAILYGLF